MITVFLKYSDTANNCNFKEPVKNKGAYNKSMDVRAKQRLC